MFSDRLIAYYRERAKGGVGLIVTETNSVHISYASNRFPGLHIFNTDDSIIPWLQKLADTVHEYDAVIVEQLSHGGALGKSAPLLPLRAPSATVPETKGEASRELELDEISELVQAFGEAAGRAREGGVDGVEIQGGHGNLITQFMSPSTNWRSDEYGGSIRNRVRFAQEIIGIIRKNVGDDFIVGMRISGDELVDGGLTLDDMKEIAPLIAPKLDYLNVSFGQFSNYLSTGIMVSSMAVPLDAFVYLAAGVKQVVDIPVMTVSRINDPVLAEKIVAEGYADLVAMTRALICDPELPNKAREGKLESIRTCVACTQGCVHQIDEGKPITCIQNPTVGKETEWCTIEPAKEKKRVVVVGGGPAGMEAAWVAARRGHRITLFEKNNRLGGQVLIAAKAPFRSELGDVARNLSRQLDQVKDNIAIKVGVEVGAEAVLAEDPDVVIVATGSHPFTPRIPGIEQTGVVTDWDVLQERTELGERALVLDGEGSLRACSVAEFVADKGKKVGILTRHFEVGAHLSIPDKTLTLQRLLQKKVDMRPHTWVKEIRDGEVVIYDTLTKEEVVIPADNVVLAIGGESNYKLYRELKGKVEELFAIGDCLGPRMIGQGIYDGFLVGTQL